MFTLIYEDIKTAILQQEITYKDKFPTIRELMLCYKTSRETIRHALNKLSDDKLITIEQGIGTHINRPETYTAEIKNMDKIKKTVRAAIALCKENNVRPEDVIKNHLL